MISAAGGRHAVFNKVQVSNFCSLKHAVTMGRRGSPAGIGELKLGFATPQCHMTKHIRLD